MLFADMSGQDIAMIFSAFGGMISAILSGIAAIYAVWAKQSSEANAKEIIEVKQATNGLKKELVDAKVNEALATGAAEEREKAKAEAGIAAIAVIAVEAARAAAPPAPVAPGSQVAGPVVVLPDPKAPPMPVKETK